MQDERLWIINFFQNLSSHWKYLSKCIRFFPPVFGTSVSIFSVKSPTLTSHIKKDTKKTFKKSKSHLILNFTAFSENLEIRYSNTLENLYLKTFHWLWDYHQQPPTGWHIELFNKSFPFPLPTEQLPYTHYLTEGD